MLFIIILTYIINYIFVDDAELKDFFSTVSENITNMQATIGNLESTVKFPITASVRCSHKLDLKNEFVYY